MKKYFFSFLLLFVFSLPGFAKNLIKDYEPLFLPISKANGELRIAIRVFKFNDTPSFLAVNPNNLETEILAISTVKPRHFAQTWEIGSTPYYQLLNKTTSAPYPLENQGLTHINGLKHSHILSIDLCPSIKSFEADFFKTLVKRSEIKQEPTPVVISISGLWLTEHPEEFQWLINQQKHQKLNITWANHSFSHPYYSDQPYANNFLLSPATNINLEILQTEKYLLEAGLKPSVFFRFPGLVSNKPLVLKLKQFGLIPLGTDAWIANLKNRHQKITPGSILLVHGNSNEHEGIADLMPKLESMDLVSIKAVYS